ncbi:MAG TPA: hypothetical protein VKE69_06410, partial [Planctomycetota bacterium]|nr:hypothetical protein [Planctomycetota bacterium]
VPWQESARYAELAGAPVELRLFARGDHRLTKWKETIARETVEHLAKEIELARPDERPEPVRAAEHTDGAKPLGRGDSHDRTRGGRKGT